MIKLLISISLLATSGVGLKRCDFGRSEKSPVTVSEACEMLKRTLYSDGEFKLTDAEIDALREVTQIKLTSVKVFYRDNCKGKTSLTR